MFMNERDLYRIPFANALLAFESAARRGNFTLAAHDLRTSQAAVSRHIAQLEKWLAVRLFQRSRVGVTLTDAGERFRDGVAAGLAAIRRGAAEAAELASADQVVIACSHETSHSLIMRRHGALRRALGDDVRIRVLTDHHHDQNLPVDPAADIHLTWNAAAGAPEDRVVTLKEPVRPVCSPAYAAAHADALAGPAAGWSKLTLLDLLRPNEGWGVGRTGSPSPDRRRRRPAASASTPTPTCSKPPPETASRSARATTSSGSWRPARSWRSATGASSSTAPTTACSPRGDAASRSWTLSPSEVFGLTRRAIQQASKVDSQL